MNCHSELNVNGISHMAERGGAPMSTECALSVHEYLVYTKSSYGHSHFLPQLCWWVPPRQLYRRKNSSQDLGNVSQTGMSTCSLGTLAVNMTPMCASHANKCTLPILILHHPIGSASQGLQANLTQMCTLILRPKRYGASGNQSLNFYLFFQG